MARGEKSKRNSLVGARNLGRKVVKLHGAANKMYEVLSKCKVGRPRKIRDASRIPLETVEAAVEKKCCSEGGCVLRCFMKLNDASAVLDVVDYGGAFAYVKSYREKLEFMDKFERDRYLLAKFKETVVSRIKKKLKVVDLEGGKKKQVREEVTRFRNCFQLDGVEVCRKAWRMVLGFSKYEMEGAAATLKVNWESNQLIAGKQMWRDDRIHEYSYEETTNIFVANSTVMDGENTNIGAIEDREMIRAAMTPASPAQIFAKLFIIDYVESFADVSPNSNDEFVTASTRKQVFDEYEEYCNRHNVEPIGLMRFYKIWSVLFPTLKLRPWKNVVGKCDVCYEIDRRRKSGECTRCEHEALKQLHHLHRGGLVMIEREKYKKRVKHALEYPKTVLSMIVDGMDQNHSRCPYLGTQSQNAHSLRQHIQGALVHGHGKFVMTIILLFL